MRCDQAGRANEAGRRCVMSGRWSTRRPSKKLTHRQSTSQNCSHQQKTQREKTRSPQPPPRHPTVLNRMASTGQRLRRSVTRGEADHGGWRFRRGCPFPQFASLAAFILKKDVRGSIFAAHFTFEFGTLNCWCLAMQAQPQSLVAQCGS
jgi:hypothetical protein